MRSIVTSKNVSWPSLIWPTLYIPTWLAEDAGGNYSPAVGVVPTQQRTDHAELTASGAAGAKPTTTVLIMTAVMMLQTCAMTMR